jgi:single-stranded-DNA-specific exonuclease
VDLHPIVERLLELRGIGEDAREAFLDPSLRRLVHCDELPGVREAVGVILPFVRDGREIVVFGDYDCDGVCASAILVTTLRRLGAKTDAFIPDRFKEGYGLTAASIDRLFREHPSGRTAGVGC